MSYYNTQTTEIKRGLPKNIPTAGGFIGNPTQQQLIDAGWLMDFIHPFEVPAGYVKVAGTRRIEITENVPYEIWDTETVAAKKAREEADYITEAKNDYKFRTIIRIFRALNDDKPTGAQLRNALETEYNLLNP